MASPFRRFVASGLGSGFLPRHLWGSDNGAGTFGAVAAALIALAISPFSLAADGDPQWVAIDEVAGTLLALTGLSGLAWAVAWAVFRAADIWKVLPGVAHAERLPGSLGITADDLVAGGYGLAAGWLVTWWF